jgi:hypothetical protein
MLGGLREQLIHRAIGSQEVMIRPFDHREGFALSRCTTNPCRNDPLHPLRRVIGIPHKALHWALLGEPIEPPSEPRDQIPLLG